jgi:tetratricopeptide (TPR) repeat protein
MYLKGSKWSMNRRRRRPLKWGRILFLCALIAGALYINQVIVPATPPLFIPTPTPTRPPESFVSEAEDLLNQGKMSQAIQSYTEAIESDPKNIANYITLAKLQVYTGDYEGAVTSAENALLLSSNNSMAHAVRGWSLGFQENYFEGEAALKTAIELDPNNGIAYAYYAELLVQQSLAGQDTLGSIDRAIEASQAAMGLAPNTLETHRARGAVLEITGNYKEAIQEYEAALLINSNIADIHLALGRNYRYIQDYARAVEEFTTANALNPADPLPDTYISRTYATVGEFAKAIQYAQQATKDDPTDPFLHGNLGTMFYRNRQYQDAIASLRLSVAGGTTDEGVVVEALPLDYGRVAEYYFTYGLTLARLGECGEALQISQALVQGVPNDETSIYNAQEMVAICQEYLVSGTPTSFPTAEEDVEATPEPPAAPAEG